jgi:hypothetical protein
MIQTVVPVFYRGFRQFLLANGLGVALIVWPKLATLKVKNPFSEKPFG